MSMLRLSDLWCDYGGDPVLAGVDLQIQAGEIVCLTGPSGCGKTTLLKTVAGLLPARQGEIWLGERLLTGSGIGVPPEKRCVGLVFQDYALFPHMTAAANIGFGLTGFSKARKRHRTQELLELVRLPSLGCRYPHQLSGGQQQRVAIVRALAPQPQLLLMDEPFVHLDGVTRSSLVLELRELFRSLEMTVIFVAHNAAEAIPLADRMAVLEKNGCRNVDSCYLESLDPGSLQANLKNEA